jgi:hypothetical protein
MAQRYATRLRKSGCDMDIEDFRDLLVDTLHGMYRNWNDEDLMHNPREAGEFCNYIRRVTNCGALSDDLILRVLSGRRKTVAA